jgi:hypothetical protein
MEAMPRKFTISCCPWSVSLCAFAIPSLLMWAGTSGTATANPAQQTPTKPPVAKAQSEPQLRADLEKQFTRTVQP